MFCRIVDVTEMTFLTEATNRYLSPSVSLPVLRATDFEPIAPCDSIAHAAHIETAATWMVPPSGTPAEVSHSESLEASAGADSGRNVIGRGRLERTLAFPAQYSGGKGNGRPACDEAIPVGPRVQEDTHVEEEDDVGAERRSQDVIVAAAGSVPATRPVPREAAEQAHAGPPDVTEGPPRLGDSRGVLDSGERSSFQV